MKGQSTELLTRMSHGDEQALAELMRAESGHFLDFFARNLARMHSAGDGEDLLQDFWLRVWTRRSHFDPTRGSFRWLEQIALNLLIDRLRRKSLPLSLQEAPETATQEENAVDSLQLQQLKGACLSALPLRQRLVFQLCMLEGLTPTEAAEMAGMNASTLRNHLAQARKNLRTLLRRMGYHLP
jgi:RNA polymerase sigma-70 factor (ECF subfamily)